MKPKKQKTDEAMGQNMLLYLEGSLPDEEQKRLEKEIQTNAELNRQLQELSALLQDTSHEKSTCLSDEQLKNIAQQITAPAMVKPLKKYFSGKPAIGIAILAAAAVLIFFLKLNQPKDMSQLDWEATEFETLSIEIELGSLALAEGQLLKQCQWNKNDIQNTDAKFYELSFDLSQFESNIPAIQTSNLK